MKEEAVQIHHIGIVVRDMQKSLRVYEELGYVVGPIIEDYIQHNIVCFLRKKGLLLLELLEPMTSESPIYNTSEGYHHICYQNHSEKNMINWFRRKRIGRIFTAPIVAPALDGREIVFACLQNGTLIELIL